MIESICREFPVKENYLKRKFEWKKYTRGKNMPYFIGFDCETFESNGNLLTLCNSENNFQLTRYMNSTENFEFHDFVWYFKEIQKDKKDIFVAYNLKFDAEVILKSLGRKNLESFYRDGEKFRGKYEGYDITYLPKKYLGISDRNTQLNFFDCMQFFIGAGENGKTDLDSVAKKYIGLSKQYDGEYQNKKFPDYPSQNEIEKIIEYCQMDCILVKKLINLWVQAFYRNFKFYPDKYYSAGYISAQYLRKQLPYLTTFNDIPYDVQKLAWKSYFGGRFEKFKRGYMKNIHHADIKSAYPFIMTTLPNLTRCNWRKINDVKDVHLYGVGFYKVHVKVHENDISPFLLRQQNGLVICPSGEFTTYCTHDELTTAIKYYDVDILKCSGYETDFKRVKENPFGDLIRNMYDTRMKQKNAGQKYVYKVLLNSLYGKFAQSRPEAKGLFNPAICATITGHTRAMLLDGCKNNKKDIVMLATDAILSTKKLQLDYGSNLGQWEYDFHPDFIGIMTGIYAYNTEKDKKLKYHSRGFSTKIYNENNEKIEFDLDEMEIKFDADNGFYFDVKNMRPLNICQSIIQKKYTTDMISKMIYTDKKIQLNGDKKRTWVKTIKDIYDYSDSYTVKI